jgi:hypothetical protein
LCGLFIDRRMPLNEDQAKDLVEQILADVWSNTRSGILGAQLKSILRERARAMGSEFDEKALGHTSFSRFLQDSGVAVVKYRGANDVLIASKDHPEALDELSTDRLRIRRPFWDAFVRFPIQGEYRGYDPNTDEIVIGPSSDVVAECILIQPIPKELQLDWRREFVKELGPESPLADYLEKFTSQIGFNLFSHTLSKHPQFRDTWNKAFSRRVNDFISDWAKRYGVRHEIWLETGLQRIEDIARAKLYTILDQVPIEELIELRIPFKWLIDSKRTRS